MPQDYFTIPILGLEIERRTDVVALAAFTMALLVASYQFLGFWNGAHVVLVPPEQIVIVFADFGGSQKAARIHARMAYVNSGQVGYNAVLAKERVVFTLGGESYEQMWQAFEGVDSVGRRIRLRHHGEARPLSISAGNAVSHETYFAPYPVSCRKGMVDCKEWRNWITPGEFIGKLKGHETLRFRLVAELYGDTSVESECTIDVDSWLFEQLAIYGWAAPTCVQGVP